MIYRMAVIVFILIFNVLFLINRPIIKAVKNFFALLLIWINKGTSRLMAGIRVCNRKLFVFLRNYKMEIFIIIVGAILRLIFIVNYKAINQPWGDEGGFLYSASKFAEAFTTGGGLDYSLHYLKESFGYVAIKGGFILNIISGIIMIFAGQTMAASKIAMAVLDVFTGIILLLTVYKIFRSRIVSILALSFWAVYGPFIWYSFLLLAEPTALFLTTLALFILYQKRKLSLLRCFVLGLSLGALATTRPALAFLWVPLLLTFVIWFPRSTRMEKFKSIGIYLLGICLIWGLNLMVNALINSGKAMPLGGTYKTLAYWGVFGLYQGFPSNAFPPIEHKEVLKNGALGYYQLLILMLKNFLYVVPIELKKTFLYLFKIPWDLKPSSFLPIKIVWLNHIYLILSGFFGLILSGKSMHKRLYPVYVVILYNLLIGLSVQAEIRYFLPAMPAVIMLSAYGSLKLIKLFKRRTIYAIKAGIAIAVLVFLDQSKTIGKIIRCFNDPASIYFVVYLLIGIFGTVIVRRFFGNMLVKHRVKVFYCVALLLVTSWLSYRTADHYLGSFETPLQNGEFVNKTFYLDREFNNESGMLLLDMYGGTGDYKINVYVNGELAGRYNQEVFTQPLTGQYADTYIQMLQITGQDYHRLNRWIQLPLNNISSNNKKLDVRIEFVGTNDDESYVVFRGDRMDAGFMPSLKSTEINLDYNTSWLQYQVLGDYRVPQKNVSDAVKSTNSYGVGQSFYPGISSKVFPDKGDYRIKLIINNQTL